MATLAEAESLLQGGHFKHSVIECGSLLEKELIRSYQLLIPTLPHPDRENLLALEKELGENKRVTEFELGLIIGLFRKGDLLTKLASSKKVSFKALSNSTLDSLNRFRVACTHRDYEPSHAEADYVLVTTRLVTSELGDGGVDGASAVTAAPPVAPRPDDDTAGVSLEIKKSVPLSNLPRPEYLEFVGREAYLERIQKLLAGRNYVISIDGIGGVGKSALALEVANRVWKAGKFEAVVWVTAKRTRLRIVGIEDIVPSLTTYETLVDSILKVLGLTEFRSAAFELREKAVLEALRRLPILLVIDNLETIEDARIFTFLKDLPEPAKALVTSRLRLGEVERIVQLTAFSPEESAELLRVEAESKSITVPGRDQVFRSLHQVTGGIPLALKIAIGWMAEGVPSAEVISKLKAGSGHLLEFCFSEAYGRFLDDDSRLVFNIFPVFSADKVTFDQIKHASGLSAERTKAATALLARLSLVNLEEGEGEEGFVQTFYSMLPLTLSYAQSKLEANRGLEKDARKRLARYFEEHLRTQDALKQYGAALEDLGGQTESGRTAALLANLALATYQRGNYKRARDLFQQAVGTDPKLSYAYQMWATVERQQGNSGRADELFRIATKLNPGNAVLWNSWGMMKRDEGDLVSSEQYLEKALALRHNSDPILAQQLAVVRTMKGEYAASLRTATAAIRTHPASPEDKAINRSLLVSQSEALFRWGAQSERKQDPKTAEAKFRESLEEISKAIALGGVDKRVTIQQKKVLKALGNVLLKQNRPKEAAQLLAQSVWDPPSGSLDLEHNHEVDLLRAKALHAIGNKSELLDLCRVGFARYRDPSFLRFVPGNKLNL